MKTILAILIAVCTAATASADYTVCRNGVCTVVRTPARNFASRTAYRAAPARVYSQPAVSYGSAGNTSYGSAGGQAYSVSSQATVSPYTEAEPSQVKPPTGASSESVKALADRLSLVERDNRELRDEVVAMRSELRDFRAAMTLGQLKAACDNPACNCENCQCEDCKCGLTFEDVAALPAPKQRGLTLADLESMTPPNSTLTLVALK